MHDSSKQSILLQFYIALKLWKLITRNMGVVIFTFK